jgi:hypothetical protein
VTPSGAMQAPGSAAADVCFLSDSREADERNADDSITPVAGGSLFPLPRQESLGRKRWR